MKTLPVILLLAGLATIATATDAVFKFRKETERGFPVGVRVRSETPSGMVASAFPKLVTVRGKYDHRLDGGPKKKEDLDAILKWEGRLDEALINNRVGFHFLSRLGRGEVRSLFYVAD